MLDFQGSRWLIEKEVAGQAGNDHPTGIPTGVFPTSDGHINIAASSSRVFTRFCETVGKPEWLQDPEWKTQVGRSKHRKEINAAIGEITKTKPAEHWIELMEANGIPCGPIYTIDQVFADPQVKHIGMARKMVSPQHRRNRGWSLLGHQHVWVPRKISDGIPLTPASIRMRS